MNPVWCVFLILFVSLDSGRVRRRLLVEYAIREELNEREIGAIRNEVIVTLSGSTCISLAPYKNKSSILIEFHHEVAGCAAVKTNGFKTTISINGHCDPQKQIDLVKSKIAELNKGEYVNKTLCVVETATVASGCRRTANTTAAGSTITATTVPTGTMKETSTVRAKVVIKPFDRSICIWKICGPAKSPLYWTFIVVSVGIFVLAVVCIFCNVICM